MSIVIVTVAESVAAFAANEPFVSRHASRHERRRAKPPPAKLGRFRLAESSLIFLWKETSMNKSIKVAAVIASLGLAACDVDQTREAEAPAVDVEAGQLPRYDVEGPEVDVTTENVVVQVPEVDVSLPNDREAETTNRQ